ncbi:MAG: glycoside hydrolase family 88 protein [Ferruginibacter sp.]
MYCRNFSIISVLVVLNTECIYAQYVNGNDVIYSKNYISEIIEKVNNYQYTHPWKEKDNGWVRGVYYTGVMASYQATGNKKYLDQCEAWGNLYNWGVDEVPVDGPESGANSMTCCQTWLECYMANKKKYKILPTIDHLEKPNVKNPVNCPITYYHEYGTRYVDALYVCPPVFAMLNNITKNNKYLEWMDSFFWDVYGALFSEADNLFYRDFRYRSEYYNNSFDWPRPDSVKYEDARTSYRYQKTQNGKKVLWARGNGWVFAGLARILKYTPKNYANYNKYQELFKRIAAELIKRQQADGFWYPNLDDPNDYGTKETSGTGFFTYGIAWGINNGILNREEYLPIVKKSWAGLVSVVSSEGKVQWGQLVGTGPYKILQEDSHEYVSGIFLLAASEMYKMNSRE